MLTWNSKSVGTCTRVYPSTVPRIRLPPYGGFYIHSVYKNGWTASVAKGWQHRRRDFNAFQLDTDACGRRNLFNSRDHESAITSAGCRKNLDHVRLKILAIAIGRAFHCLAAY